MKLLTLFICFPFFCHSTDIVIPLSDDNIVEPKRYTFFTDFEAKVDSEGHLYSVQKVSENIQGALSLSDFIIDINKYQFLSESLLL